MWKVKLDTCVLMLKASYRKDIVKELFSSIWLICQVVQQGQQKSESDYMYLPLRQRMTESSNWLLKAVHAEVSSCGPVDVFLQAVIRSMKFPRWLGCLGLMGIILSPWGRWSWGRVTGQSHPMNYMPGHRCEHWFASLASQLQCHLCYLKKVNTHANICTHTNTRTQSGWLESMLCLSAAW